MNNRIIFHKVLLMMLLMLLFQNCSVNEDSFGITQKYKFNKNERYLSLDKSILEMYGEYTGCIHIPLNRCIHSKDYKIFIGLVSGTESTESIDIFKNDTASVFFENKADTLGNSSFLKHNKVFVYSYIYPSRSDNMTFFIHMVSDSVLVKNMYDKDFIPGKIIPTP